MVLDNKSGTNNQYLIGKMMYPIFFEYVPKIGLAYSQVTCGEHFINCAYTAKVVVLVICQEMYMYYLSSHIHFLCKYTKYLIYGIILKGYLCFFRFT